RNLTQYIIGTSYQSIFFAEHLPIFRNKSQSVHVGINNNPQIRSFFLHQLTDLFKVLLKRLRIMRKVTRRLTIKLDNLYAQLFKKPRNGDPSGRIDSINGHSEPGPGDKVGI